MEGFLFQAMIYLAAAVIAVPIAARFGLGSVLGYLLAGIAIGPFLSFFDSFKKHLGVVEKIMGGFLVVTGILFLTGDFTRISFWMLETFPFLSNFG